LDKKALPYILLLSLFWGSTLVASRFSVDQFTPALYIGLRFSIAGLAFAIVYSFRIGNRRWPKGRELWIKGTLMGVLGSALNMLCIVSSLQYLSSGLVSIMISVGPAFIVIMAHIFLDDERLTTRKAIGVVIALVGAVLLIILGESGIPDVDEVNPIGYVLVLGGVLSGSIMTIYARKYMQDIDTFDITGIRMFIGMLVVLPYSILLEGFDISKVDSNGLIALFYAAIVGSLLGLMLSLYNIQKFGPTAIILTSYLIPIVAGITGVLILGEKVTWGMIFSIIIILLGISIINPRGRRRPIYPNV
jgi:drug/metabolite transporter (DMT)-like permease